MPDLIHTIVAVKRKTRVQLLYYCPRCESVNELDTFILTDLECHDCEEPLSAEAAVLEVINPGPEEQ